MEIQTKQVEPHVVAFGGGVDSTAMVIGLVQRKEPIDLILFADTGGERPSTYEHIKAFSAWLKERGYPGIITVWKVKDGERRPLSRIALITKAFHPLLTGLKGVVITSK